MTTILTDQQRHDAIALCDLIIETSRRLSEDLDGLKRAIEDMSVCADGKVGFVLEDGHLKGAPALAAAE